MKIRLTKKRLYTNLLQGLLWFILGISYFIFEATRLVFGYAYLILGLFYLAHFFYDREHQYLIIDNGWIHKNIIYSFKNKIKIDDLQEVKRMGGNYVLKSKTTHLKIDPDLIHPDSLKDLNEFLVDWGLPSEKLVLKP